MNGAPRGLGEDGEAGDGDQREVEGVAEALGGAEADADSGEGAGAVDDGDGVEQCRAEAGRAARSLDGWDEALGGGAAGEGQGGGRGGRRRPGRCCRMRHRCR